MKSKSMGGLKKGFAGVMAVRGAEGLQRKAASREDLEVYLRLDEGMWLEGYLRVPCDAGTPVESQI